MQAGTLLLSDVGRAPGIRLPRIVATFIRFNYCNWPKDIFAAFLTSIF